jgi:cytochrome c oxidase cbb3-type subunit I/II
MPASGMPFPPSDNSDSQPMSTDHSQQLTLESEYQNRLVGCFMAFSVAWWLLAIFVGILQNLTLLDPLLSERFVEPVRDLMSLGRLSPIYRQMMILGFVTNLAFAGIYYATQRLCLTRLWSSGLGWLHLLGWQASLAAGCFGLALGMTQGKEFSEFEWPIDLALAFIWIGLFGVNFFATLARRKQPVMDVSLWYFLATVILVPVWLVLANLAWPVSSTESLPFFAGITDGFVQWRYGYGMTQLLMWLPFLGLYYFFTRSSFPSTLPSHRLAVIQFWSLVVLLTFGGLQHIHFSPLPEWISSIGALCSLMIFLSLWITFLQTKREISNAKGDVSNAFFGAAKFFLGLSILGSVLLAIKSINAWAFYTELVNANLHFTAMGWIGFMACGIVYRIVPISNRTQLWSPSLASAQLGVMFFGMLLWVGPVVVVGVIQALNWNRLDSMGRLSSPEFLPTLQATIPYLWPAVFGGVAFFVSLMLLVMNWKFTYFSRGAQIRKTSSHAKRPSFDYLEPMAVPSQLKGTPVLDFAATLDQFSNLRWHLRWEQRPWKMVWAIVLVLLVGLLIEFLPMLALGSSSARVASIRPYTPLELVGRGIYVREGCCNCHSQFVRPLVAETLRFGDWSKPIEFQYDRPIQWGSRRVGPDLAREGGKQTSYWHWVHLNDPRVLSPGSVMPHFRQLLIQPIDEAVLEATVKAAHELGDLEGANFDDFKAISLAQAEKVAGEIITQGGPVEINRRLIKDTQAVALIAYLQRLGTDLSKPEAPTK